MNYIILAAGKGTRLHPYTRNYPKSMIKLADNQTVLQRTINLIKSLDQTADITVVVGYEKEEIENQILGCKFVENPFYDVTNSIASLWFCREKLSEETVIINADVVFSKEILELVIKSKQKAFVCLDSSIKKSGDYNVQTYNNQVIAMSKELDDYFGEYAGITKLNKQCAMILKDEISSMVNDGFYNEWYENALVRLILNNTMELEYIDIQEYDWAELDSVNDLFLARKIINKEDLK